MKKPTQSVEAPIRLIRIEGQTRKPVEYRLSDFIATYTADCGGDAYDIADAKKEACDLAERLLARQRLRPPHEKQPAGE